MRAALLLHSPFDSCAETLASLLRRLKLVNTVSVCFLLFGLALAPTISTACCPPPSVTIDSAGSSQVSGYTSWVDPSKYKIVIYALTNEFYVQPFSNAPFTDIASDGTWSNSTHHWDALVVLVVDPAKYTPPATTATNPALDPNVIAYTTYPLMPTSLYFGVGH